MAPKSLLQLAAFSKASEKVKTSSHHEVPTFLRIQGYDPANNEYSACEESEFFLKTDLYEEFYKTSLL